MVGAAVVGAAVVAGAAVVRGAAGASDVLGACVLRGASDELGVAVGLVAAGALASGLFVAGALLSALVAAGVLELGEETAAAVGPAVDDAASPSWLVPGADRVASVTGDRAVQRRITNISHNYKGWIIIQVERWVDLDRR